MTLSPSGGDNLFHIGNYIAWTHKGYIAYLIIKCYNIMFKLTLLTILMLSGAFAFVNVDLQPKKNQHTQKIDERPQENDVLNFSYNMNILQYQQMQDGFEKSELPDYKQFKFVPQKQRMRVKGSLNREGTPYIDINIIEKSNRPWIKLPNENVESGQKISRVVMDGNRVRSFDERGNKMLDIAYKGSAHKELVESILGRIDPQDNFVKFIQDAMSSGKKVTETESAIAVEFEDQDHKITLLFDKETGLPVLSKILSEKEIIRINFTFECINGKYVLVVQRTSVVKKDTAPGEPLIEFISLVSLDDISINY
jgi:hypothetical protein